jgi:CDP-paratose 2-epimerase
VPVGTADWRPGDQKVYVSNTGKAARELGWTAHTSVEQGLRQLVGWVRENEALFV